MSLFYLHQPWVLLVILAIFVPTVIYCLFKSVTNEDAIPLFLWVVGALLILGGNAYLSSLPVPPKSLTTYVSHVASDERGALVKCLSGFYATTPINYAVVWDCSRKAYQSRSQSHTAQIAEAQIKALESAGLASCSVHKGVRQCEAK